MGGENWVERRNLPRNGNKGFFSPQPKGEPRSPSGRALNRVAAKKECEVKVPKAASRGLWRSWGRGGSGGAARAEAAPLGHALS